MKKIFFLSIISITLLSCDKTYVCNCGNNSGGLPYRKVYLKAKSDNSAERKCSKQEESGESCVLQ